MTTEDDQAEAVLAGISGALICECGLHIPADHYQTYVSCECGVSYRLFKKIGWKVSKRSPKAQKALEKRLRARIALLEERIRS